MQTKPIISSKYFKKIDKCRSCTWPNLIDLFSLGDQYVTDFPKAGHEKDGIIAPLDLVLCEQCKLVQLKHTVERDEMYRNYFYKSGMNQTMRDALKNVVESSKNYVNLYDGDTVIDIGSNDGTLLTYYPSFVKVIGFEPARNLWLESSQTLGPNYTGYNDYFSFKGYVAKVITTIAMFYDLDDPNQFVEDIKKSLADDGIWINQQNYLSTMLINNTFDNISHEHLEYYSLLSMEYLLRSHGLEVIDVEENDINGGSFRAYIAHLNVFPVSTRVGEMRQKERLHSLQIATPYHQFFDRISQMREDCMNFIIDEVAAGKSIYLYGASTRGHVILQFYGLDTNLISGAAERNPDKYGLVTIGTGIPIMSEEEVRALQPDYMFVLPYAFKKEFIEREAQYLGDGGHLIFPLPSFEIV